MSLLLLFNQGQLSIGGGGLGRGGSYNRREVDALYDDWKRKLSAIKNKKAKKAVEEAIEALESAEVRGLLSALCASYCFHLAVPPPSSLPSKTCQPK